MTTSTTPPVVLRGGCMCSKFRYKSTGWPVGMLNCTCVQCRKAAGAPYQSFARFMRTDISWETEEVPKGYRFSKTVNRGFCDNCGSSLTFEMDGRPEMIWLMSGSIDDWEISKEDKDKLGKPDFYVWMKENALWHDIPRDGLPKWKGDNEGDDAELISEDGQSA